MGFDEDEAVRYMRSKVPADVAALYDNDELVNLIDIIWDYYEINGLLDISLDDDDDDDVADKDEIVAYARKMVARDKGARLRPEHVEPFVVAELEYEQSVDADF